jgi:hypothetical protein
MNEFKITHNLDFLVAEYPLILQLLREGETPWMRFKVGTCEGLWRAENGNYEILAIDNKELNNGHFQDTMEWFENSCKREGYGLKFLSILNKRFMRHLVEKRGFLAIANEEQTFDCIKPCAEKE